MPERTRHSLRLWIEGATRVFHLLLMWWKSTHAAFRWGVGALLFLLIFVAGYNLQSVDELPNARNNVLVFFLMYLNVIFLCILTFIIGRNILRLIFDRKNSILGSKLRMRLVVAFAGLALVTNIVLFIFAGGLLSTALENWFGVQVEDAVSGAVEVSKHHYASLKDKAARSLSRVRGKLEQQYPDTPSHTALSLSLETERQSENLFGISVYREDGSLFANAQNAAAVIDSFSEPAPDKKSLDKAVRGRETVIFEEKDASQFIRGYAPLSLAGAAHALVVTIRIDPELSTALGLVNDTYKEYSQLKLYKTPLKTGYLLTLTLITVVILFSAVWFGFYISKQLTTPIQDLAEATQRVARGDYDVALQVGGDDEIGFLLRSFNTMLQDLKVSRADAERRRLFIEAILSRLIVGVVAVRRDRTISSLNSAAINILGLRSQGESVGRHISDVFGPSVLEAIDPLLREVESMASQSEQPIREVELSVVVDGSEKKIVTTAGRLTDSAGAWIGAVLLFDDITELTKAQAMAVWREVARRIAHEIKNPLTPIQLSAQRLQKLIKATESSAPVIDCANTIVENVDLIKRLANEFSNFARMPTSEFVSAHINRVVSDVVSLYASAHADVVFQFVADNSIPQMQLDIEQIKRLLLNIIDNAIDAMRAHPRDQEAHKIVVKSEYDVKTRSVTIEISDNGPGITSTDKIRIFEPYFTTKKGGTGLGLAIALSIVSDHQGTMRVVDNQPRGAKFIISLPIDHDKVAQSRLSRLHVKGEE